ncbi:RlmE family RNA methyltransferase [bacterium NHP-B]|nr:RlmE family RNA methyltransferase [bacterium NHP-B]
MILLHLGAFWMIIRGCVIEGQYPWGQGMRFHKSKTLSMSSQQWLRRQFKDPYVKRAAREGFRSRAAYKLMEMDDKYKLLVPGQVVVDLGCAPGSWSEVALSRLAEPSRAEKKGRPRPLKTDAATIGTRKTQAAEAMTKEGRTQGSGGSDQDVAPALAASDKCGRSQDPSHDGQRQGVVMGLDLCEMTPLDGALFFQGDFLSDEALVWLEQALAPYGGRADVVLSDMAPSTTGHKSTDHLRIMALSEAALDFAQKVLSPKGHFVAKIFQGGGDPAYLKALKQCFSHVHCVKPASSRKESSEMYVVARGFKGTSSSKRP